MYEDKTVEELRKLASSREVSGRSEMNREDLIRALNEQDQSDPNTMRTGQFAAMTQQIEGFQTQLDELAGRVTQLEIRASGPVPNDPIPQRR